MRISDWSSDVCSSYLGHRTDERFALCATFKWPLSAVVLKAIDDGKLTLDRRIPYGKADLLPNSPVTESHVGKGGMTVGDLMEATITTSDNAAANLLLPLVGGRSEEHTSELQSLMRISYAVFCLKKQKVLITKVTVVSYMKQTHDT